jgi:hypothetical protein
LAKWWHEEIAFLNRQLGLAFDFAVLIETCQEANAFYDPETGSVTLCAEFETYLSRQYEKHVITNKNSVITTLHFAKRQERISFLGCYYLQIKIKGMLSCRRMAVEASL